MSKTIGIDLGTTNSCVCFIDGTERVIIPNSEGGRTTPSVVAFSDDSRLVGVLARRQAETNPENTVFAVKRLMGRRFDDEMVRRVMESVPYGVVESESGDAWVRVKGKEYSPPEISSFILADLKRQAEDFLGQDVTDAVITVPAYFNDAQRQATRDAGRIAGMNVLRIINEPTAAALAYGLGSGADLSQDGMKVAVYDLGGGTFDISILELADGVFSVLSTSGDTFLGGEDFDYAIIDWLVSGFKEETGADLRGDNMAMQRLKEEAERAKMELSSLEQTTISLPFIFADATGPKHIERVLTRAEFEKMTGELVKRTLDPCGQALREAGLSKKDINAVILVGGMTRMPLVRQQVAIFFQKEPDKTVNPDEVVAMGAAIQGGIVRGELTDVLLLDVTPLTLGIETMGGVFTPLIPANTTIPCTYSEVFSTTKDNQEMVRVHVLQGERAMADENKSLAKFELHGIPPAPRGLPKIEVTFKIDENGMVSVNARDLGTGRQQSVSVVADGGLSEADIERMIQEADEHRSSDSEKKAMIELRNRAQGLVYSTERSLGEYGEFLTPDEREEISYDVQTVKELLEDANKEELEAIIASLEASAYRLAEAMYAGLDTDTSG
ncbi:molecular chaperone DnaK [Microvenator marinus]|jgi:molecular chaperone DnaK|uniref:Chaperone protein DnaK n=1 Tax=Microvenator marinus TaxID=2600177 RepID=A0A5B8XWA0_9DELT|nr:molecular chaperone DnaK [Microvenator marinus]QED29820.1 molecular chaperone DnaK [Microvenator marinus]